MKNFILIQNEGEIDINSFELIGASTKRNDSKKIGFFGSGLKYSIAYMMRTGIAFRVFSGDQEITFSTQQAELKGQAFDRICINGRPTSFTVTMGPTWTKDWFVLREIYCNAIDEEGCQVVKSIDTASPSAGRTRIFIELTESLENVLREWDRYFSDERTPMYDHPSIYTSGLGLNDGINKYRVENAKVSWCQPVKIYQKTKGVLYRRGVNVHEDKRMLYDYEFQCVDINEDRTAKATSPINYAFTDMMGQLLHPEWVKNVLRTAMNDHPCAEYLSMSWSEGEQDANDEWVKFSRDNMLVVKEISGRYSEAVNGSSREVFFIPAHFCRWLKKQLPEVQIVGMGMMIGDTSFSEVEITPKQSFLLKEVIAALKEMGYEVPFPVTVVEFSDDKVLGEADPKAKQIYISAQCFDHGRRMIANVLIEETEHIRSGHGDETRAFQTHLISQWLKSMEEKTGLFL